MSRRNGFCVYPVAVLATTLVLLCLVIAIVPGFASAASFDPAYPKHHGDGADHMNMRRQTQDPTTGGINIAPAAVVPASADIGSVINNAAAAPVAPLPLLEDAGPSVVTNALAPGNVAEGVDAIDPTNNVLALPPTPSDPVAFAPAPTTRPPTSCNMPSTADFLWLNLKSSTCASGAWLVCA